MKDQIIPPPTITDLSVYPQTDQVVGGFGRILRERTHWCVEYTVSKPGFVDRSYCPTFTTEESAWAHIWKLDEKVGIPTDVLASASGGLE